MSELVFKSAGVSSREIDLSFPTQGQPVGVPAGVIGTAKEGPAFVPVTVSNFSEFLSIFGDTDGTKFGPLAVGQWLKNAQSCTYIRVLGIGNGKKRAATGVVTNAGFVAGNELIQPHGNFGTNPYANSGVGATEGRVHFLGCFMSQSAGSTIFSDAGIQTIGKEVSAPIIRGILLAPSGVALALSGNQNHTNNIITANGTNNTATAFDTGTVSPKKGAASGSIETSNQNFVMLLNGHKGTTTHPNTLTASFDTVSNNYFADVFNKDPLKIEQAGHLLYAHYDIHTSLAVITGSGGQLRSPFSDANSGKEDTGFILTSSLARGSAATSVIPEYEDFKDRFRHAESPYVITQKYGSDYKNLFKIHALSDGADANTRFKVSIENITRRDDSTYPTFDLVLRDFFDSDESKTVLESFRNITLDPGSSRFVGRAIGDLNVFFDFDKDPLSQKINVQGDHPIRSRYIRVEMTDALKNGDIEVDAVPFGFRGPLTIITSGSILGNISNKAQGAEIGYSSTDDLRRATIPPVPYRDTIALGTGTTKRASSTLYWGAQFNRKTSVSEPNKPSLFDDTFESLVKYFPRHRKGVANFAQASDTINNNVFTMENILVRTGSTSAGGYADPDQWLSASYHRAGGISSNQANKTRAFRPYDLEIPSNRRYAKFSFFLQGGFDGVNIFDQERSKLSNIAAKREVDNEADQGGRNGPTVAAYRKAVDVMGSKSDVDIKLLAIPGIRVPTVTDFATTAMESRFDALYIMDIEERDNFNLVVTSSDSNVNVTNTVTAFKSRGLDSSFAAAYFPDVVIEDPTTRTSVVAPPSVAALGAFSLNDAVAHPWFAPAGFTRGALDAVEMAKVRLSRKNLDDLYDADINPLTAFPGTGVVIWGQKTLLNKASALDRVNVRRLLIDVRRAVRNVANTLLFEPNRSETLERFNTLVNPILQRVQEKGGVDRFKVIIDTTTTTQADVENNTIRGKIFLQPTRAVEFIALDFVVTNAGANI